MRSGVGTGLSIIVGVACAACNALNGTSDVVLSGPARDGAGQGASGSVGNATSGDPTGPLGDSGTTSPVSNLDPNCIALGPRYGTVARSDSTWQNAMLALVPGDGDASVNINQTDDLTTELEISGFAFSIPAAWTIVGIAVDIDHCSNRGNAVHDHGIRLDEGTIKVAPGFWPVGWGIFSSTYTRQRYGGTNDTWGAAWTPAKVEGLHVYVSASSRTPDQRQDNGSIDSVGVTVFACP